MAGIEGEPSALTDREQQFCHEFIIDFVGKAAAIRAGAPEASAKQRAYEMLAKAAVQDEIGRLMAERVERTQIDADWVLLEAKHLYEKARVAVLDTPTAPLFTAARGILDTIGKHVSVQAFREQVALTDRDGGPIRHQFATPEEFEAVARKVASEI